jgi:hypothetical protein
MLRVGTHLFATLRVGSDAERPAMVFPRGTWE